MALLSGITVTELSQGITGPYCAQMMGDLGAEVIKVEPLTGDRTRQWGPSQVKGVSAVYLSINRNKRSIAVDLSTSEGREVVKRLIKRSDVLIEEFLGKDAEAVKLDYNTNKRSNPKLIQLNITGYGERGPMAEVPASELPVQAMLDYPGGLGEIGLPPLRVGADLASNNTAVFAFQAVMAALIFRGQNGKGQRVSVSMAGTMAFLKTFIIAAATNPDEWAGHLDSWTNPRSQGFQCKDGAVWFNFRSSRDIKEENYFAKMLGDLGMEKYINDPRFADNGAKAIGTGSVATQVKPIWEKTFADKTVDEVVDILRRHGAWAFPMSDYRRIAEHEQTKEIGIIKDVPHPKGGTFKGLGNALTFTSKVERERDVAPPLLGADTDKVLTDLGYTARQIATLREKKAVSWRFEGGLDIKGIERSLA